LSRRIIDFHKVRQIQPRHGRSTILKRKDKTYYRWCFSDLKTAQSFIEQFGGTIKTKINRARDADSGEYCYWGVTSLTGFDGRAGIAEAVAVGGSVFIGDVWVMAEVGSGKPCG
jgi:hypothetical protein